jgi:hypothetical protein
VAFERFVVKHPATMITFDAPISHLGFFLIEIIASLAKLFTKLLRLQFPLGDLLL